MRVDDLLEQMRYDPQHSDTAGHFDTLRRYARGCLTIVELGTHDGSSTVAFMTGRPETIFTVDVHRHPNVDMLKEVADEAGVYFSFTQTDSLLFQPQNCDLLFIDTKHTYDQCIAELNRHGPHCRQYIILHDTDTYGEHGDHPDTEGLWKAIGEFLKTNDEWLLAQHFPYCSGLTVLMRVGV